MCALAHYQDAMGVKYSLGMCGRYVHKYRCISFECYMGCLPQSK